MNRKLHIQKNRGSNSDQGNSISSQGFGFPNSIWGVLVKTEQAGNYFRTSISTVIFQNSELGIYAHQTRSPAICHLPVLLPQHCWPLSVLQNGTSTGGPSSQVLHSVLGQFKFKPVEISYWFKLVLPLEWRVPKGGLYRLYWSVL